MIETTQLPEKKEARNSNIEILRFILMLFICFWHIIMHGLDFKDIGTGDYILEADRGIVTFFCALFSPAVYCFMFISGWYGIHYSKKKYLYFACMGFACFIISIITIYCIGDTVKLTFIITHLFPIACNNWWFLTCYIMVFLVAPFIDCGLKMMDSNTIKQILYILTFMEVVGFFTLTPYAGYSFFGLLYIYILARYMRLNQIECSYKAIYVCYLSSLLLLWGACYWATGLFGKDARLAFIFLGYSNPLIIIMAIAIFFFVKGLKPFYSKWVNLTFSNTLIIYLMTEGIGGSLYQFEASLLKNNMIVGILFVIATMFICLLIGRLLSFFLSLIPIFQK